MSRSDIGRIVESERSNARLGWVLIAFVVVIAAANLLEGDLLGAGFAASVVALVSFPSIAVGSPRAMLP